MVDAEPSSSSNVQDWGEENQSRELDGKMRPENGVEIGMPGGIEAIPPANLLPAKSPIREIRLQRMVLENGVLSQAQAILVSLLGTETLPRRCRHDGRFRETK